MKDQVILCTEENKGAPLKEYWESRGVDTEWYGCDSVGQCYGVISGQFAQWGFPYEFKGKDIEIIELPKPYPRVMEVWGDVGNTKWKEEVLGEFVYKGKIVYLTEINETFYPWKHARDIPTKRRRMTLEEIAQELGVDEVEVIEKTN